MDAGSVLTGEIWRIQRQGRSVRRSGFCSCKSFFLRVHHLAIKKTTKNNIFFTCLVLLMGRGGECIKYISEGNLISHRSNRLFCLRFSIFQRGKIKHCFLPLSFFLSPYLLKNRRMGGGGIRSTRVWWTSIHLFQSGNCETQALAFHNSSWKGTKHLFGIYF